MATVMIGMGYERMHAQAAIAYCMPMAHERSRLALRMHVTVIT